MTLFARAEKKAEAGKMRTAHNIILEMSPSLPSLFSQFTAIGTPYLSPDLDS